MTKKNIPGKRPFSQDFSGTGKTQQHFKDSCDVNNIVAHYLSTGIDLHADRMAQKTFGYASSQDFSEAMRNVAEINSAFADQPATIRQEFSNDPASWLESLATRNQASPEKGDPESSQELREIPVLDPDTEPKTDKSVVN